jgi:hypothetical protein
MPGPTTDAALLTIYKTWYTDAKMENLLFRSSPTAKIIKKTRVGGKTYNFAALYSRGGAAAGDMTVAVTNAASGTSKNAEFAVTTGQLFSVFNITQQEILASQNVRGAYGPAAVNKTFAATDAFRKLFATSLFGTGFGEVGKAVVATTIVGSNTVDFADKSLIVKLDVGVVFQVTNGALPSSSLRTSVNTITAINGTSVTFTATAIETWAATDWVEIQGCRSGSSPLLPVGLPGWLPDLANRTGGTWTSYIGTSFFGVDRSVFPDRLAGNFVLRNSGASEKYVDALVRGVEAVRIAGGEPKLLILSPYDWRLIVTEIAGQQTYFNQQNFNGKASKTENTFARGISDQSYMFSTSWVDKVMDDPFCPQGVAYILDEDVLEFACLSNVDKPLDDGITPGAPGAPDVDQTGAPEMQYKFIIDDYITIQPGVNTVNGPAAQVSLNMYGAWCVRNPGHCCVVKF